MTRARRSRAPHNLPSGNAAQTSFNIKRDIPHYPEDSAFLPLMMKLLLSGEQEPKPPVIFAFAAGEVTLHLDYVRDALGDNEYILGDAFQAPDIGITYIVSSPSGLGN